MAKIRITHLKLRTIIGINPWEREKKQDITLNITLDFNADKSGQTDNIDDTIDYKQMTKQIIQEVEGSQYYLLEKMAQSILNIIMANPLVEEALVRIDKPWALRFSDSVSLELSKKRDET